MDIKVFISYSHKDEIYKDHLIEVLIPLKRSGTISVWHDRDINAGDEWKHEISSNLTESNVILFLISSSFLASEYCYEIEAKEAIRLHASKTATLIPIIVRPCEWEDSPFSKFHALPKDAKAVNLWTPEDLAWKDIAQKLKKTFDETQPVKQLEISEVTNAIPSIKDTFLRWLDDTEVILTHRKVTRVKLTDIYVYPDIKVIADNQKDKVEIIPSSKISTADGYKIFFGDEQQGKTTFLKRTFLDLLKSAKLPIYLQAKDIKQSNLNDVVKHAVENQYDNLNLDEYLKLENKVLLIDDLSEIGLNDKFRAKFLADVNSAFNCVIITANSSFSFICHEVNELSNYSDYILLDFGHEKRAEIIEKWVALGNEECISEDELFRTCDDIKGRLDLIVRRNIVPARPIYLLMLLQMFEAYSQQNLELTSYGHCYQELIYQSFKNAGIQQKDVNQYINVLTELAWAIHLNGDGLNHHKLDEFFDNYEKTYLKVDRNNVMEKLKRNSILREIDFKLNFKYPYLFYFFTAKKIADYYQKEASVKIQLRKLLDSLHREDYANILVFVTHHTKDSWILDEIQKTLQELFSDQDKATLTKNQLVFMDAFISKIPELVMEQREIRKERQKHNQKLDQLEMAEDQQSQESTEYEVTDILAKINKTFKGMDIAGQIIRNRHASMTRDSLYMLAEEGTSTGLRFLEYFINITDIAKSEVIKHIEFTLVEHPDLSNKEVQEIAQNIFVHLTYGVINGVIHKIASSIGSKEAEEIYEQLEKRDPSPAIVLLKQAIKLKFNKVVDIREISSTQEKLKNNPVCSRILKEMVIQHTYMFPVGYKEKQQLCEILNISVQGQRVMDMKKIGKG